MTNPLLYDIRRTLTSKSVLVLMAVLIVISFAILPGFNSSSSQQGSNTNNQIFAYYDANGYHFIGLAWNEFGEAVSGVNFEANVTVPTQNPSVLAVSGTTNSSGITLFSIAVPENSSYATSLSVVQPNGIVSNTFGSTTLFQYAMGNGTIVKTAPGAPLPVLGSSISTVLDSANASARKIQVSSVGPYGSAPVGYEVYYKFFNVTEICQTNGNAKTCSSSITQLPSSLNKSDSTFLGTMNNFMQIFPSPPEPANLSDSAFMIIGLSYPNGTGASIQLSTLPLFEVYPPLSTISPAQGNQLVVQFFESIFGLFIPLIAIVGTYNSYGKDRVSGVLESVLAQPVSRRGLSLSRFVSTFVAMAVAICVSIAVIDVIAWYVTKSFVDSTIVLSSTGAFLVELATFVGIMMLCSHLVRSSGALIGLGIGLFIVIDFFWSVIISLLAFASGIQFGSARFFQLSVAAQFVNPAQFVSLVDTYLTHFASFVGIGGISFPITPEAYWITIPSIIATAALWIVLPLVCFLYLAIKRD